MLPFGEAAGGIELHALLDRMERDAADLDEKCTTIDRLARRAAALHEARTSRVYFTFREETLADQLNTMTVKYQQTLARLQDMRARLLQKDPGLLKGFGIVLGGRAAPPASDDETIKRLRADLACAGRLRDEAEGKVSAYEDFMLNRGISHREMAGVLDCCVRSDRLMVPVSKRTNGITFDHPAAGPSGGGPSRRR